MLQDKRNRPAVIVVLVILAVLFLRAVSGEPGGFGSGGFGGPPGFDQPGGNAPGDGGWMRHTPGGTVGGTRDCFYYNDPEGGSSVMSQGC